MRIKHNLILSVLFTSSMLVGCNVDNKPLLSTPITMLLIDKKEALTPPASFDYSYTLQTPPGVTDPIWYFKDQNNNNYSTIYWTRTNGSISGYNYDTGYLNLANFVDFEWRLQVFNSSGAFFNVGGSFYQPWYNYLNASETASSAVKIRYEFMNFSKYNYFIYFDMSSTNATFNLVGYYGLEPTQPYTYINIFNSSFVRNYTLLVPAFTSVNVQTSNTISIKTDAIYFSKQPLSQGMGGYGNENYNSGYGEGFNDGFESIDNLEWLENVATAVKDIFSVEIFPGFTVGFIVLFPLVVAIVKWFLSLFGIGGGGS